jgi:hypothetical protein
MFVTNIDIGFFVLKLPMLAVTRPEKRLGIW